MTPTASRILVPNSRGTQNHPSSSSAHVASLSPGEKPFNDQDDESNIDRWPQSTLKQSRLMIWINGHLYKGLTICAFTALTLMVLLILVINRPIATSFPRDDYSYQGCRIGPDSLRYCKYYLFSRPLDTF